MTKWVGAFLFILLAWLNSGCFVEEDGLHREQNSRFENSGEGLSLDHGSTSLGGGGQGLCRYSLGRGCFDGYLGHKKDFFVAGRSFFNSDDFASHFSELLEIQDQEGRALIPGQDFKVEVITPIDQKSFASGFEFELSGVMVRMGKISDQGSFSISNLPDDDGYELRVQRPVQFKILKVFPTTIKSQEGPETKPNDNERLYCATLFQDAKIVIQKGMRTYERFNDFKMHFSANECQNRKYETKITI